MFSNSAFSQAAFSDFVVSVIASVSGVEATGAIGDVTVVTVQNITVPVTGVQAAGQIGTVTVIEGTGVTVAVTSVVAVGVTGTVVVSGSANVYPEGVVAYGEIGYVNIWQLIPTVQSANWTAVPT